VESPAAWARRPINSSYKNIENNKKTFCLSFANSYEKKREKNKIVVLPSLFIAFQFQNGKLLNFAEHVPAGTGIVQKTDKEFKYPGIF
jgi:hypothetical protein